MRLRDGARVAVIGAGPSGLAAAKHALGPMLPPRYRLSGPGAAPGGAAGFSQQLAASPRAPVDDADVEALGGFGWTAMAAMLADSRSRPGMTTLA